MSNSILYVLSTICLLISIGIAVLFAFLNKKSTWFQKLNIWVKRVLIGVLYTGLTIWCFATSPVINEINNSVLSVAFVPVAIAILMIDYIGGSIAVLPAFFFRAFAPCFSSNDYFRWVDSSSVIFACALCLLIYFFILHKKRPVWLFAFFTGVFLSIFMQLMIYAFCLNYISIIYSAIALVDIVTIFTSGICFAVAAILISLVYGEKENVRLKILKNPHLHAHVRRRLFVVIVITFAASFSAAYLISNRKAVNDNHQTILFSLADVEREVDASFPEQIKNIANEHHILTSGFFVITDSENEIISIRYDFQEKYLHTYFSIEQGGTRHEVRDFNTNTVFEASFQGVDYACAYVLSSDYNYNIIGLVPTSEIMSNVGVYVHVFAYLLVLIFFIIFATISNFISHKIVDNIHTINGKLNEIIDGNLDTQVKVNDPSEEFEQLSSDINLTVGALKNYATEIDHRMKDELELARNIQESSVPKTFPQDRAYDVYGSMQTAEESGGDYYDYIRLTEDKVAVIIADVVGSGIAATMYMIRAKTIIQSLLVANDNGEINLEEAVNKCNKELTKDTFMNNGMSAFFGLLTISTGKFEYINADHCTPLIKQGIAYAPLKCENNRYLGIDDTYHYIVEEINLSPGDEILMFTDGIPQARNKNGEEFGTKGIMDAINNAQYFNAKQVIQIVNDNLLRFTGGVFPNDDVTSFCFKYKGSTESNTQHEITLKAIPNNTPIATKFVESIMQQYNCSPKSQATMLIAVDELFSNIAYYAYKGQPTPGNGTIRIEINGTEFKMLLIDNGTPFNPIKHLDPNYISSSAEERTNKGGLGIFMVRRSVDDMKYNYENGQNILTIIKTIPEMHEEEFKDSYSTTRD